MPRNLLATLVALSLAGCGLGSDQLISPSAEPLGGNLFIDTLDDGSQLLILDGEITQDTSYVFQALVEQADQVGSLIVAYSPGGDGPASHQIGRTIERNGSSVIVLTDCLSACVNILIAGKDRVISEYGRLGLHASNLGDATLGLDERYWSSFGLAHVIRAGYTVPHESMWFIEPERAIELRLATEIMRDDG